MEALLLESVILSLILVTELPAEMNSQFGVPGDYFVGAAPTDLPCLLLPSYRN